MTLPGELPVEDNVEAQERSSLLSAFGVLFSSPPYIFLAVMTSLSLLLLYTVLFQLTTTFEVFFLSNSVFYIVTSIVLTMLLSAAGGVAITQTLYIVSMRLAEQRAQGVAGSIAGTSIGALAAGCPSCASLILPALGIAGSLAAFPLAGLEIKLLSLLVLVDVIWENSRAISGVCAVQPKLFRTDEDGTYVLNITIGALRRLRSLALILFVVVVIYLLPFIPSEYRVSFASENRPNVIEVQGGTTSVNAEGVIAQINPTEGYTLPYTYGDIGPKLLEAGAFDLDQFAELYSSRGAPLSEEQLEMLREGSNEPITINKQNANFLLNLFWALGLTNQNSILEDGPMFEYSQGNITTFASTGGWTLAVKPIPELYSSAEIITLTQEQQALVEEAASGTYRPCCGNSTLFPDCNHGMAMLGLFEVMASQGATLEEMFEAAKYFNAFWFPQQTYDLAVYFEATTGDTFAEVDSRTLVGQQYSSGNGWRTVRQWLSQNGLIQQVPGGGGCGV